MVFEVEARVVPSGAVDRTLSVYDGSADRSDAIKVTTLPYPLGYKLTFSMWSISDGDGTDMIINVLGKVETVHIEPYWTRCEILIEEPVGRDILITPVGSTKFWLYKAQLELGEAASDWVPSPDEFYSGSVISMNEHEVYIGTEVFEVDIANGAELLHIDEDGVVTNNMTVNKKIIAPNIAEKYTGASTVTLGAGSGTGRTTLVPGNFGLWYTDHVLQGDGAGHAVVNANNYWDMYRYVFDKRTTIQLKSITDGSVGGVLSLAYELNSTYIPLTSGDIDSVIEADALLINCMKTTRLINSQAVQHTATPSSFTQKLDNRAMMIENGYINTVERPNWDICRLPFSQRTNVRIDSVTAGGTAGVVELAFEQDGVYYPIGTPELGVEFEATALLINCMRSDNVSSNITLTPSTAYASSSPAIANSVLEMNNGNIVVTPLPNWNVFRTSLNGRKTIVVRSLTPNSNAAGSAALAYELNGAYYPVVAGGQYQADALLVSCRHETWTDKSLSSSSFGQMVYQGCGLMQDVDRIYVQDSDQYDIIRWAFPTQQTRFKLKNITTNPATSGTCTIAYESGMTYYPMSITDTSAIYTADALVINRKRETTTSWASQTALTITDFSLYRAGFVMKATGNNVYFEQAPYGQYDIYRKQFDSTITIKTGSISRNSNISDSSVITAAYELNGQVYVLPSNSASITCDAILLNRQVGTSLQTLRTSTSNMSLYRSGYYFGYDESSQAYGYIENSHWDVYNYAIASNYTYCKIVDIELSPDFDENSIYSLGGRTGTSTFIPITRSTVGTTVRIIDFKVNYAKTQSKWPLVSVTYILNSNTAYYSTNSIPYSKQVITTNYQYSAPSMTISTYSNDITSSTSKYYSITQAVYATIDTDNPNKTYSISNVVYTTDPNSGTIVTDRSFSIEKTEYIANPGELGASSFENITDLANAINNRVLTGSLTVNLTSDIYGGVWLGGMSGIGSLIFNGNGHSMISNLSIYNQNIPMLFNNLTVKGSIGLNSCKHVSFNDCTLNGNNGSVALYAGQGTICHLVSSRLFNAGVLATVYSGSTFISDDIGGANAVTAFLDANKSVIIMSGTRPVGNIKTNACLTAPSDLSTLETDDGGSAPGTVNPSINLTPIAASSSRTYYEGTWYSSSDSNIRQGFMDMGNGGKVQSGCMWFPTSSLSSVSIKSASLTLTRVSGKGTSADVEVDLWGITITGPGEGQYATEGAVSYGQIGTIGNGETKELPIPLTAINALKSGSTIKGFMLQVSDHTLKNGKGYSTNYAVFYGAGTNYAPVLKIVGQ